MKLTPRMANAVNDIIQEEVQSLLKSRQEASGHRRRGMLLEAGEDGHSPMRQVEKYVNSAVSDRMHRPAASAVDFLYEKIHEVLVKELFKETQARGFGPVTLSEARSFLDDEVTVDVEQARAVFCETVSKAITEYSERLVETIVKASSHDDEV